MIKRSLTLIVALFLFNLFAQDTNTQADTITISDEVVSSIEDIDSLDEELLDSLYDSQDEPAVVLDTGEKVSSEKEIEAINTKEIKSEIEKPVRKQKHKSTYKIKKIFNKLYAYKVKILVVVSIILFIMIAIFTFIKRKDGEKFLTSTRLSLMDKEVQIACKYLEKNYSNQNLTVEEMCEELVTGAAFLEALFIKELGMSIKDFLVQVRINRARDTISNNPSMPSYEIAEKCGYSDAVQFEKDFKTTTGLVLDDYISSKVN